MANIVSQSGAGLPPVLPEHIGIIMDGNGRWATQRSLSRSAGHKAGMEAFSKIAQYCSDIGIRYVTFYAFSTENWKRPKTEIDTLMSLMRTYIADSRRFADRNIRLRFIGDRSVLDSDIVRSMERLERDSVGFTGTTLNIAVNYGGRADIVMAAKRLSREVKLGNLSPEDITEQLFSRMLYTAGQPDPDLIIRPSGEKRLSNFMLWQSAYAEFVFMQVLWPDFTPERLNEALWEYYNRDRRFGGVK